MALLFVDLPPELIIRALQQLHPYDLAACQLSCSAINDIVKSSVLLQYNCALELAGLEDNQGSTLSLSERYEALKSREFAWSNLAPNFIVPMAVKHNPSGIYDLSGDVYLLGNADQYSLHYCQLPSSGLDVPEWKRITFDRSIIDMGLNVLEHDLIAVITTRAGVVSEFSTDTYDIELYLLKLSTGTSHPDAKVPLISVMNSQWERPAVGIEIVGKYLVLVLSYHMNARRPDNRVFVYEWRTGMVVMQFSRPYTSYYGPIFLTENLFILPNARERNIEFWAIPLPDQQGLSHPSFILALPRLQEDTMISRIACRGEPNPTGSGYLRFSKKPFHTSASSAIIIISLHVVSPAPHAHLFDLHGQSFTFFVHRSALLNLYNPVVPEGPKTESGHLPIMSLKWSDWGPPVTRWIRSDNMTTRWITTTAGQRAAFVFADASERGYPFLVYDFNPYDVVRVRKTYRHSFSGFNHQWYIDSHEIMSADESFAEEVESRLPYTALAYKDDVVFDGVLLDEERILGLKVDLLDKVNVVRIHHFG